MVMMMFYACVCVRVVETDASTLTAQWLVVEVVVVVLAKPFAITDADVIIGVASGGSAGNNGQFSNIVPRRNSA